MPRTLLVNTPDVAPQVNQGAPFFRIEASPDDFGAGIARAVERGGEQAQRTGDVLAQNALRIQETTNEAAARDTFNKASEAYRERSMTDGIYGKKPAQLYGDGQTPFDVYKQAKKDFEAAGKEFSGQLNNPRAQLLFNRAWGEHGNVELGRASSFAASSHKEYIGEGIKAFSEGHKQTVADLATNVEKDWRNLQGAEDAAANNLKIGLRLGMAPDEVAKEARTSADTLRGAAVRGWFNEQPDLDKAAEKLSQGKVDDPQMQAVLDKIAPAQRTALFNSLLETRHKIAVINNANRETQERADKEAAVKATSDFFFKPNQPLPQLQQQFDALYGNVHVPIETKQKMQQFIRDGGRDTGADSEADNLTAELSIRADQLKTPSDIMNYVATNHLQVSVNSIRTRLLPMLQAQSDKHFNTVLDWGENELGFDKSAAASGIQINKDTADKARKFRADMIANREKNPDMDIWQVARSTVADLKKQGNTSALGALPVVTQQYRDAIATGDTKKIANARSALVTIMQTGGMVTPQEASQANFDPLSLIEQSTKPTNPRSTP